MWDSIKAANLMSLVCRIEVESSPENCLKALALRKRAKDGTSLGWRWWPLTNGGFSCVLGSPSIHQAANLTSGNDAKGESSPNNHVVSPSTAHQLQRLPSMDDDKFLLYPNLFTKQSSNLISHAQPFIENSISTQD
ncbi:unnamed protein product [Fraxinus pennsylvanica]|uniref:Uncharacterized protein n=1 Tax=Fraxinus pennsylvanica TaxID=56036 RepID=A0AAD1ZBP2_9LAMI|nr:unnamed protein product [Fraxinus pennsylvanica]